jgi:hypothetical protein
VDGGQVIEPRTRVRRVRIPTYWGVRASTPTPSACYWPFPLLERVDRPMNAHTDKRLRIAENVD